MRNCFSFLVLGLLLSPYALAGDDFKLEPGFKLLFNGKNLDGWKSKAKGETLDGKTEAYTGRFKVAEGKLIIDPKAKGDVRIQTAKDLKDVHIKFEFHATDDKCNNDLFLRGLKFDIVPKALKGVKEGWNELEIIAQDGKVEVKINGVTNRKQDLKFPASPFEIRAEFGGIEFKNMRVKE